MSVFFCFLQGVHWWAKWKSTTGQIQPVCHHLPIPDLYYKTFSLIPKLFVFSTDNLFYTHCNVRLCAIKQLATSECVIKSNKNSIGHNGAIKVYKCLYKETKRHIYYPGEFSCLVAIQI